MHPHLRFHDIRDPLPEAMHRRTNDTAEEDVSRLHFAALCSNRSVLCYGGCSAILSPEKGPVSAYNIFKFCKYKHC